TFFSVRPRRSSSLCPDTTLFRSWMSRWPTPSDLAGVTAGEAIRAWGRLGYPRRALRLHAAAIDITRKHDGQVPDNIEELRSLPRSEEHTSELQSRFDLVCRLLLD